VNKDVCVFVSKSYANFKNATVLNLSFCWCILCYKFEFKKPQSRTWSLVRATRPAHRAALIS